MLDVTCSHSDVLAPALCNDCGATVGVADAANETYSGNDQIGQVVTSAGFVGRQREVGELVAGLEWAIACRGQVVMLAGDPGIGKTRAAQELASIADSRNAEVYWGHCYESAGAPPYWPWLQIIRSFVDEWDAERLDAVMGLGAQAIGEIVPELRSKLPNLESPQTFDPDSARPVVRFDHNVSEERLNRPAVCAHPGRPALGRPLLTGTVGTRRRRYRIFQHPGHRHVPRHRCIA